MIWLGSLDAAERAIVHWLTCTAHNETLGRVFRVIQTDAIAIPLFLLAAAWIARRDARPAFRMVAAGAIAVGVGMLIATVLWASVPRERPPHHYQRLLRTERELATCAAHPEAFPIRDRISTRRSFPSRHGITIGVFATVLLLAAPRIGLLAVAYGLFVAVGRVYVGRHWPSDMVVGMALGAALAWAAWRLLPRFIWPQTLRPWIDTEPVGGTLGPSGVE